MFSNSVTFKMTDSM